MATVTAAATAATAARAMVATAAPEQDDYGRWILLSLMDTGTGSSGAVGRCGGGLGRPVSLDTHRLGRPSYLLTVLVGRCTAST